MFFNKWKFNFPSVLFQLFLHCTVHGDLVKNVFFNLRVLDKKALLFLFGEKYFVFSSLSMCLEKWFLYWNKNKVCGNYYSEIFIKMDVYKRRTILFVTTIICWQNAKNILKLRLWVIYVLYTECTVQYYSCVHVHKMKSFNLKVCSKLPFYTIYLYYYF